MTRTESYLVRQKWFKEYKKKYPQRDYVSCKQCGASTYLTIFDGVYKCEIELHHKKTRGGHPELAKETSNLTPLCYNCHRGIK
jgi:5-methylcytosine-specific restriction endonuclease McrA